MNAILNLQNFTSSFVAFFWTPIFVGIFLAIAGLRALAPQPGGFRRGVQNAIAGGLTEHDRS